MTCFPSCALHVACSIVSSWSWLSSLVTWYSFLCSRPSPPPLLFCLLWVWNESSSLSSWLDAIHALSSSVSFNQVSVTARKSRFCRWLFSSTSSALFLIDLVLTVAILICWLTILLSSFISIFTRLLGWIFVCFMVGHSPSSLLGCLLILNFLTRFIVSKGILLYLLSSLTTFLMV